MNLFLGGRHFFSSRIRCNAVSDLSMRKSFSCSTVASMKTSLKDRRCEKTEWMFCCDRDVKRIKLVDGENGSFTTSFLCKTFDRERQGESFIFFFWFSFLAITFRMMRTRKYKYRKLSKKQVSKKLLQNH